VRLPRALLALAFLPVLAGLGGAFAGPPKGLEKWAFLVGVDDYAGSVRSNIGAVGDVRDFRAALVKNGFPDSHIRTVVDGQATAQAIREGLAWLRARAGSNSLTVFHYSGHVKQSSMADGDGESLDESLWGHDNRFVTDGELGRWARTVPGWLWVDIAGCEAAGLDDGIAAPRRLFTGSSQEDEKSYEHPDWRNSIFTGLAIEDGILRHRADYDRDGVVSIHEAVYHAGGRAAELTSRQKHGPQHPVIRGGDGYAWFLDGKPAPTPKAAAKPKPAPPPPPKKVTRTVVLTYQGPSARLPDGSCPAGCFTLTRRSSERYVKLTVRDASGKPVAVGGPFGVKCDPRKSLTLPTARSMQLYLPVEPSCSGVPTQGTITVVFSNLP
jgi:hypothetical protein